MMDFCNMEVCLRSIWIWEERENGEVLWPLRVQTSCNQGVCGDEGRRCLRVLRLTATRLYALMEILGVWSAEHVTRILYHVP